MNSSDLTTFIVGAACHVHSPLHPLVQVHVWVPPIAEKNSPRVSRVLLVPHFPFLLIHRAASFFTCMSIAVHRTFGKHCKLVLRQNSRLTPVACVLVHRHHLTA